MKIHSKYSKKSTKKAKRKISPKKTNESIKEAKQEIKKSIYVTKILTAVILIALVVLVGSYFIHMPTEIACEEPYINYQEQCCLDEDMNSICDFQEDIEIQETEQIPEELVAPVVETEEPTLLIESNCEASENMEKCYYKLALQDKKSDYCYKAGSNERACMINLGIPLTIEDEVAYCKSVKECVLDKALNQNNEDYCPHYGKLTADTPIGTARCIGEIAKHNDDFERCIEYDNGGMLSYFCAVPFIAELKAINSLGEPLCYRFIAKYKATCMGDVKTKKWQK